MAAVGRGEVHNQLQLAGRVLHVLVLEGLLLGRVGPGQALVEVHAAVQDARTHNHPPADGFEELSRGKKC